jgi:hypothetical protein
MEDLLREAFQLGQQWVKDMNNEQEPTDFNTWYNSDDTQGRVKNCSIHAVMPRLFAITTQGEWNEMFWDKDKAQHKIDTEYKKDFPNEEFWVDEVRVS